MNWKPIDTAPHDGTQILAFGHYIRPPVGPMVMGGPNLMDREVMPIVKQIRWYPPVSYPKFTEVSGGVYVRTMEEVGTGHWGLPVSDVTSSAFFPFGKWEPSHWTELEYPDVPVPADDGRTTRVVQAEPIDGRMGL